MNGVTTKGAPTDRPGYERNCGIAYQGRPSWRRSAHSTQPLGVTPERLCAKASGAILSQASQHDPHHSNVDPSLFTAGEHLIIFGKPSPCGKPGERSLHDPAPLEDMEATRPDLLPIHLDAFRYPHTADATPGMLDDLDLPTQRRLDPFAEAFLLVSAIGPDQLQTRKNPFEWCQ